MLVTIAALTATSPAEAQPVLHPPELECLKALVDAARNQPMCSV